MHRSADPDRPGGAAAAATPSVVALCGTLHLTDFAATADPSFIEFKVPDPIGDAGALSRVLDPENLFIVTIVFGLLVLIIMDSLVLEINKKEKSL